VGFFFTGLTFFVIFQSVETNYGFLIFKNHTPLVGRRKTYLSSKSEKRIRPVNIAYESYRGGITETILVVSEPQNLSEILAPLVYQRLEKSDETSDSRSKVIRALAENPLEWLEVTVTDLPKGVKITIDDGVISSSKEGIVRLQLELAERFKTSVRRLC